MSMRPILCLCATVLMAACVADTQVLNTGSVLDVKLVSPEPILPSSGGPLVRGPLQVSPHPIRPVCDRLAFYVDNALKLATDAPSPVYVLDTLALKDGPHSLRIEAERGGRMVLSTGEVEISVANEQGKGVLDAAIEMPEQAAPEFAKLYKMPISTEAVWINGLPADLEHHAFAANSQVYITLTDLLRHIGGRFVWGPSGKYIEVHRNDVTVQITPGKRTVTVNGQPKDLGAPTVVRAGRTWVPLKPTCDLFGIYSEWNGNENRAYVYTPQPNFGIQLRDHPWVDPVTGAPRGVTAGVLTFRNETDLPIHVRLVGNGFQADWQIRAHHTIGPHFAAPGTYRIILWATHGEDFEDYITVAAGVHDTYYVTLSSISLIH